jgi:hypothetical protein
MASRRSAASVRFSFSFAFLLLLAPEPSFAQIIRPGDMDDRAASPPPPDEFAPDLRPEPRSPPFGARGALVGTAASTIGLGATDWDGSEASSFSVYFSPGADYFLLPNVSLGLSLNLSYSDGKGYGADGSLVETKTTTLSGGPRFGLNVPFGDLWSFYPRLTVGLESVQRHESLASGSALSVAGSPLGYPSTTEFGPWLTLDLKLLVHPKPHFFLGAGPSLFHEFGHVQGGPEVGGERTTVGAGFVVGGWFGGRTAELDAPASDERPPPPRKPFGDRGEVVLAGDITASGYWTGYAGSNSYATSISFGPAVDYFAAQHISIGIGLAASYSMSKGLDASSGATVTNERTSYALAPRVGFDVPIGVLFSWYPRVTLALGAVSYDEMSGASENKSDESYVSVSLYAPVLVHPATHIFAGFGPAVGHDLTRPHGMAEIQNRSTSLGADLVVGGWL